MLAPVSYLYDATVHERMVRFAAASIAAGHMPFTTWFPYMGMGSEQFLHYQSLASVLTGLVGTVVGASTAFRWSMYLLVAMWPVAIYLGGRLWGTSRAISGIAGALAPFVVSYTGIGFERGAYSWTGGAEVWTQLFGSWALCFAWPLAWRALHRPQAIWAAAALGGLTIDFHFLSGYLALLGTGVMMIVAEGPWLVRLRRAVLVFTGTLLSASWVVIPLILTSKWAAQNQALANTPYVRGYGARQELDWLFTGQLFDARRAVPVLTVVVLAGAALAVRWWRRDSHSRALLALMVASLLLSFGPTTWGPVMDLVPAHADLYFRRFTMGLQLAGVYLAATATVAVWSALTGTVRRWGEHHPAAGRAWGPAAFTAITVGITAWFVPAWSEIASYDVHDAAAIHAQQHADRSAAPSLLPILAYITGHEAGRVYAGTSSNWGQNFLVGYVQMYKYLEGTDVDLMTYMVPTLSPMLGAESYFDDTNPADYGLFGVRFILLPAGAQPPVPARLVMTRGPYSLWERPEDGYTEVVSITGVLSENRADVGQVSAPLLANVGPREDFAVSWDHARAGASPTARYTPAELPAAGRILQQSAHLSRGLLEARVSMKRYGVMLAAVAYDPGWHAFVDGKPARVIMMAPAVMGVVLRPGTHTVVLRFRGFSWYPELWALSALCLLGLWTYGQSAERAVERCS